MSAVDIIERGGDLLVSSETIAEGSGVEHRAVLQLVANNMADFEDFGLVAFEMRARSEGQHGGGDRRVALLNEQQATLLMTFQRNTPQVREFKKALVRAFFDMARKLTAPVPDITTPEGVLALAQTLTRTAEELVAARNTVAVLEPRAEAWDELASADGDYAVRDAAAILVRAGIKTGPQRLFETLGEIGWTFRGEGRRWRPYAKTLDAGYMAERAMPPRYDHDGIMQPVPPQVRITARGLERLRVRLGVLSAVEVAS